MLTNYKRHKKARLFLEELRRNGGFLNLACVAVHVSKQSVYNWRKRHAVFATAWDRIVDITTEELETEARRRAYEGVDKPVFFQGKVCGHVREYSDTMLIFTLKGRKPDVYRDNLRVTLEDVDTTIDKAAKTHNLPLDVEDQTAKLPA